MLDNVTTVGAVLLAATYSIGAYIVNVNLAQWGITEYQVLRVKYLAVGLVYLLTAASLWLLAGFLALLIVYAPLGWLGVLLLVSTTASLVMLQLFPRPVTGMADKLITEWAEWGAWVVLSVVSIWVPLAFGLRQLAGINTTSTAITLAVVSVGLAMLAIIAQTSFYGRRLYGRPSRVFGWLDPVGSGAPAPVQIAGNDLTYLSSLGVPMASPRLTEPVLLIDETVDHYIIEANGREAVKVIKEDVKAIRYDLR